MHTPTLVGVAGGGLAAALALGAAVPALASGATSSTTTTASSTSASTTPDRVPLSGAELVTIDQFYENHPVLGHRLAAQIDSWKTFLDNHPNLAAKVQEWQALTPEQRRVELHAWLIEHPTVRRDLAKLRADRREFRRDLRELRRDLRP
jgi:hypothetical protein